MDFQIISGLICLRMIADEEIGYYITEFKISE